MKRPNKYRNQPVVVDGIRFASKAEAKRYGELKLLDRAGQIAGLTCQPRFKLTTAAGEPAGVYVGDFAYGEHTPLGYHMVCEDVKSPATCTRLWRLKWKLVQDQYREVEFRVVMAAARTRRAAA